MMRLMRRSCSMCLLLRNATRGGQKIQTIEGALPMSLSVSTTKGSEKGNTYYLDRARSPFARRTYASGSAEAKESKSSPAASWANLKEYEHICGKEAKLYAPKETGENHGIGRIELDRPHAANAVGKKLLADLEECTQKAAELGRTNRIRCLVFHSSIKIFCAGTYVILA